MRDDLHKFDDIVHYSVRCVKGVYGGIEYAEAVTSEPLAVPFVTILYAKWKAEK